MANSRKSLTHNVVQQLVVDVLWLVLPRICKENSNEDLRLC